MFCRWLVHMCPVQHHSRVFYVPDIKHLILNVLFFIAVAFLQHNTSTSKSAVFSFAKSNMSELLGIYVGVVGVGQIGHSSKLNSRSDRNYSAAFLQSGNIQIMYRPWLDLVNE